MFNSYSNNFPKYNIESVTNGYMLRIEWRADDAHDSPAFQPLDKMMDKFSNIMSDMHGENWKQDTTDEDVENLEKKANPAVQDFVFQTWSEVIDFLKSLE